MKILLSSHHFHPSVGGIESVSLMLAEQFVQSGHDVRVATQTQAKSERRFSFPVLRRPSPSGWVAATRWCDVMLHQTISLRAAWPLLLVRRPWFIAHHTWICRTSGALGWQDQLKRRLMRFATSISVSSALADSLPVPSVVIPNPYDERIFYERPQDQPRQGLIFVGRLVCDKGANLLIEAVGRLKAQGLTPPLTVVGEGPDMPALRRLAGEVGVAGQTRFVGTQTGEELATLLNRHQIAVVPSRWREPFGLVALEGIACGCVIVGSEGGGLKAAIGRCGLTFPNGDVAALVEALAQLLRHPETREEYRQHARPHLARHRREVVAQAYLTVLASALCGLPRRQTATEARPETKSEPSTQWLRS